MAKLLNITGILGLLISVISILCFSFFYVAYKTTYIPLVLLTAGGILVYFMSFSKADDLEKKHSESEEKRK